MENKISSTMTRSHHLLTIPPFLPTPLPTNGIVFFLNPNDNYNYNPSTNTSLFHYYCHHPYSWHHHSPPLFFFLRERLKFLRENETSFSLRFFIKLGEILVVWIWADFSLFWWGAPFFFLFLGFFDHVKSVILGPVFPIYQLIFYCGFDGIFVFCLLWFWELVIS